MKTNFILFAMMVLMGLISAGCSSNNSSTSAPATNLTVCQTNYVYSTQFGCVPQGTCPAGYGSYNNSCVVLISTPTAAQTACQASCPTGYVSTTTYGCLLQGPCQACFGHNAPYCVSGSTASSGTYYLGF